MGLDVKKEKRDVHGIAECTKEKERTGAEERKPKRPHAHERLDEGESPAGCRPRLGGDGSHAAHAINDRVDLPMGADAQHHSRGIPSVTERVVQREEDKGAEDGFGGSARGDAEHEWIE